MKIKEIKVGDRLSIQCKGMPDQIYVKLAPFKVLYVANKKTQSGVLCITNDGDGFISYYGSDCFAFEPYDIATIKAKTKTALELQISNLQKQLQEVA